MADAFLQKKFRWLDQVLADKEVGAAFRFAYAIATKFWSRKTGDAWPSQDTLSAVLQRPRQALQPLAAQLINRGHLEMTAGHGPGQSNHYRPILKASSAEMSAPEDDVTATAAEPEPIRSLFPKAELKPKRARAAQLPENWQPSGDDFRFALDQGLTHDQVHHEADTFRDHWFGNGKPKVDWQATWRNWTRRAAKWQAERAPARIAVPRQQSRSWTDIAMEGGE